jgi:hypothetical protein
MDSWGVKQQEQPCASTLSLNPVTQPSTTVTALLVNIAASPAKLVCVCAAPESQPNFVYSMPFKVREQQGKKLQGACEEHMRILGQHNR